MLRIYVTLNCILSNIFQFPLPACEAAVSALIDLYIFGYDLEQITNALEVTEFRL